ncbi:MAG: hypothetical protein QXL01_02705 [Thermoplasmatales archaeon]
MSLPFEINGAITLIPGVYDTFSVASSPTAPIPAGRSIVILGEAEEGVPGSELNLSLNRYTDFQDVKEFYKSGPIVDAARMIFANQPSPVFGGAVQALYIYKTNASLRASRDISSPANFGSFVAARYGESGNLIKSRILTHTSEVKPFKSGLLYLPSPVARNFQRVYNGIKPGSPAAIAAAGTGVGLAAEFATDFAVAGEIAVSGGTARTGITPGAITVAANGDELTITSTALFGTNAQAGDVAYIAPGGTLAGSGDANAGAYLVVSWSANEIVLRQLKHVEAGGEANAEAFDTTVVAFIAGDLQVNAPVTISLIDTTISGTGASLEILEEDGDKLALGMLYKDSDYVSIISSSTAAVAKISASVPSAGKLTVSLSGGSFSSVPKAGDMIRIPRGSLIQGATLKNVGLMVVESASAQSMTLAHLFSGMTTEAVSQVNLNGSTSPFTYAPGFVSSSVAAKRLDSSAELKRKVEISKTDTGAQLPTSGIGGNVVLELGYWNAAATAATLTIDQNRILTIDVTGPGLSDIVVNTKKYKTLQQLVDFLNTQSGVSCKVASPALASQSPNILDMVTSAGCLSGHALSAQNARIKKDYYDWKQFFLDNNSLVAFRENAALILKCGLPSAESSAQFLSGAAIGATSNASIQAGLDAALKVDARIILPLFSRDAQYDVEDGLTDANSSYTIDSINAAVRSHVSTASSTLFRKERFGQVSFDGSFEDAKMKAAELSYERTQMAFQRCQATAGDGSLQPFLPWMVSCAIAAGRVQSALGTSMLRKPFLLSGVSHVGQLSLYTDTLTIDFDPDDRGQLEEAIAAGLVCMRSVPGFGVRMESPDLSTRSRVNDPEGWVYERVNVLFTCDEVRQTLRNSLENFIGNRTSDTPLAVLRTSINNAITGFVAGGSLLGGQVLKLQSLGNVYKTQVKIIPAEALEAIIIDVEAERSVS